MNEDDEEILKAIRANRDNQTTFVKAQAKHSLHEIHKTARHSLRLIKGQEGKLPELSSSSSSSSSEQIIKKKRDLPPLLMQMKRGHMSSDEDTSPGLVSKVFNGTKYSIGNSKSSPFHKKDLLKYKVEDVEKEVNSAPENNSKDDNELNLSKVSEDLGKVQKKIDR